LEVKAKSNAHVSLASAASEDLPIHEIFFGGWENSKSAIRHNKEKPEMAQVDTPNLLNPDEFKRFWIEWNHLEVNVGLGGEAVPFMRWENRIAHPVAYFGLRTYYGSDGHWQFPEAGAIAVANVAGFDPSAGLVIESGEAVLREKREEPTAISGTSWVAAEAGNVPEGAVVSGFDNGQDLYVGRASHEGELIPGKLLPAHGVVYIPWGGLEIAKEEYEVFVAAPDAVSWVPSSGGSVPDNAIPGGLSEDGQTLYIGRAPHEGTMTSGKIHPSHGNLYISYGGAEIGFPDYEVLVKN